MTKFIKFAWKETSNFHYEIIRVLIRTQSIFTTYSQRSWFSRILWSRSIRMHVRYPCDPPARMYKIEDIAYTQKRAINPGIGSFRSTLWIRTFRSAMFDPWPAYVHTWTARVLSAIIHIRLYLRTRTNLLKQHMTRVNFHRSVGFFFLSSGFSQTNYFFVVSKKMCSGNIMTKVTIIYHNVLVVKRPRIY